MRILLTLLFSMSAIASDHGDHHADGIGPKCYGNKADIVDFYSFVTPDQKKMVFIQNLKTGAAKDEDFAENIIYQFRTRPAKPRMENGSLQVTANNDIEDRIRCQFSGKSEQAFNCVLQHCSDSGCKTTLEYEGKKGEVVAESKKFKVFAGVIYDPFITAPILNRMKRPRNEQLINKRYGRIGLRKYKDTVKGAAATRNLLAIARSKTLSVVAEVDLEYLASAKENRGAKGIVGAVAETVAQDKGSCHE